MPIDQSIVMCAAWVVAIAFALHLNRRWNGRGTVFQGDRSASSLGAILLVVAINPWFDSHVQQSIVLHSLQSAVIHHAAPFLLMRGVGTRCVRRPTRPHLRVRLVNSAAIAFSVAMSAMWVWPEFHYRVMTSDFFYNAMKWSMVLGGILVCSALRTTVTHPSSNTRSVALLTASVALPQIFSGMLLMTSGAVFPAVCIPGGSWTGLDAIQEQRLSGAILTLPVLLNLARGALLRSSQARRQFTVRQSQSV